MLTEDTEIGLSSVMVAVGVSFQNRFGLGTQQNAGMECPTVMSVAMTRVTVKTQLNPCMRVISVGLWENPK
jgi:hypothetical protein